MNLKKELRKAGYDLIGSPVRNHRPLQLWIKERRNRVEFYYENIAHAFMSDADLDVIEDPALSVNYQQEQNYKFNIGITVLEDLLEKLNLGNLKLAASLKKGKKVSISYSNSKTLVTPRGMIENFLSTADFNHKNSNLLKSLDEDEVLVISGILTARDIKATIETDFEISSELEAKLKVMVDGKVDIRLSGKKKLELKSENNLPFPIAVKANRIIWDKGEFVKLRLVTDNRFFF